MFKIKYKLLIIAISSVFLLAFSSFYIINSTDKINHSTIEIIETTDATEKIISHVNNLNRIIETYSKAEEKDLKSLEFEIELDLKIIKDNIQIIKRKNVFEQCTSRIEETINNISVSKNQVLKLKKEEIKLERELEFLNEELRANRTELKKEAKNVSKELEMPMTELRYIEKELDSHYKNEEYIQQWNLKIEEIRRIIEEEELLFLLAVINNYETVAIKTIARTHELNDLKTNKEFHLILTNKNFCNINLSSTHISKTLKDEFNNTIKETENQKKYSFFLILLSALIGGTFSFRISNRLTDSINKLIKGAEKIASGNLNEKISVHSKDEIGKLASIFNKMTVSIKKSKDKLRKEREQLKLIISSIGEGLIVIDNNYKLITLNKVSEKFLKIKINSTKKIDIRDVLSLSEGSKKLSTTQCPITNVLKNKTSLKVELKDNAFFTNKSNKTIPVEISIEPLSVKKLKGAVIIFKDITKLKEIEKNREFAKHNIENVLKNVYIERDNVQKEKTKLKAILNSIGDAVLTIDANKNIITLNPVAEKITGFRFDKTENLPYDNFINFISAKSKKKEGSIIDKILKGETITSSDNLAIFNKNKKMILVDMSASPVKNKNEEIIGCIIVFRDVTKKREEERMRSDFVSTVSHQIRTPLSAMKWFIEILSSKETGKLTKNQTEIINEIKTSNHNIINLVNQMLSFSRIENKSFVINSETTNLNDYIQEIIKEIAPLIKEKNQKLTIVGLRKKSFEIKIDKNILRNVIYNLLDNASKYTPNGGKIKLNIKKQDKNNLLFTIKDSGIGIPEDETSKIFNRFSRANNAIKYEASGTGLGLYIIKSMLDLIGGKIWFKSMENKGTEFFFTFPINFEIKKSKK